MRIEIPESIQEYFKDKMICATDYKKDRITLLYEDFDKCLELKINDCSCSLKMPKGFFRENTDSTSYIEYRDLIYYTIEEDTNFFDSNLHNIRRYIIKLQFDYCSVLSWSFYYYKFCSSCNCIDINIIDNYDSDIFIISDDEDI